MEEQGEASTNDNSAVIEDQRKEESFAWSDASTKLFLGLYKEEKDLLINRKIKTRKVLWLKICEIMQSHGYKITMTQAENKFKSLERLFKNMIANNKQTGRGRTTCPYQT